MLSQSEILKEKAMFNDSFRNLTFKIVTSDTRTYNVDIASDLYIPEDSIYVKVERVYGTLEKRLEAGGFSLRIFPAQDFNNELNYELFVLKASEFLANPNWVTELHQKIITEIKNQVRTVSLNENAGKDGKEKYRDLSIKITNVEPVRR